MRRRFVLLWLIAALLSGIATALEAQSAAPACADTIGRSMAFLQGDWEGNSYSVSGRDTRAYDAPTQRWLVYYVDDQLNSQIYEGRREASNWRFIRTRLDRGTPIQVRLTWRPTGSGYEQLIERSRDAGATWTLGGIVTFKPRS
jgi:hypothetical protein